MKNKLKVGDTVRRTNYDHGILKVGDTGKIASVVCNFGEFTNFKIEGEKGEHSHSSENLEKVETVKYSTIERDGILLLLKKTEDGKNTLHNFVDHQVYTDCYIQGEYEETEIPVEVYVALQQFHTDLISKKEVVKKFKPLTKYHLYGDGVEIFGFSSKDRESLMEFIEGYGRENGFRVLDAKGITKGYIHPELLSKLSYHLQDL